MIRTTNLILLVAVVVTGLFRFGVIGYAAHSDKGKRAKPQQYVLIGFQPSSAHWREMKLGLSDKAKELKVVAAVDGPPEADATKQMAEIDAAVARKVDGILLAPVSDAVSPAIDRAIVAGIGVICVEWDAPSSKRYTFVGRTPREAGVAAGEQIASSLNGSGDVVLNSEPCDKEVAEGYRESLGKYKGIHILGPSAMLSADAIACTALPEAQYISEELRKAGKTGHVKVVTVGSDSETLTMVEKGMVDAAIGERTYTMSYIGLQMLYDLRNGRVKLVPDWRKVGVVPLPLTVDTGTFVITKRNVEYFRTK